MLGKILLTLGVVLVVALIWRTRGPAFVSDRESPRLINAMLGRRRPHRRVILAAVVLVLITSSYLLFAHWQGNREVISVRVVDAGTGRTAQYRAQRGDIEDREFVTTDGRHVVLADTERLETGPVKALGSTVRP